MKRFHLALSSIALTSLLLVTGCASTGGSLLSKLPPYHGPKQLIAVADFQNKSGYKGQLELGAGMADMLTDTLVRSGRFIIVERQQIRDVLREQDFSKTGRTVEAAAPQIGRLLNAQVLVTGSVVDFSETHSGRPGSARSRRAGYYDRAGRWHTAEGISLSFSQAEAQVTIAIRLIDATNSQVLDSQETRGTAKASALGVDVYRGATSFRSANFAKTPLGQATQQAIDNAVYFICTRMQDVPWQGRVVEVKSGEVYINAGEQQGIAPGNRFAVFHEGPPMMDPDTGLSLGAARTQIGEIEVIGVEPKFSTARIVSGQGMARGDIIRFLPPTPPLSPSAAPVIRAQPAR